MTDITTITFNADELKTNAPTVNTGAANKTYVDGLISGAITTNVIAPTYDEYRFFGEIGSPLIQGFTEPGAATDISPQLFEGTNINTVRLNDNDGSIYSADRTLTAADWQKISDDGGCMAALSKLDATNGSEGFFMGLQCDAADSPDASLLNRRWGIRVTKNPATNELLLTVTDTGASNVAAGTVYSDFNKIELVAPPLLADAALYVNDVLVGSNIPFATNTGGTGTKTIISSGSSGGTDRVTYHIFFGAVIYTSPANVTVGPVDFDGFDVINIITPPCNRDYTFSFSDAVENSAVGKQLITLANNVGGQITFNNATTTIKLLANNRAELIFGINEIFRAIGTNVLDGGNSYFIPL